LETAGMCREHAATCRLQKYVAESETSGMASRIRKGNFYYAPNVYDE
jgi:hypothetical protein